MTEWCVGMHSSKDLSGSSYHGNTNKPCFTTLIGPLYQNTPPQKECMKAKKSKFCWPHMDSGVHSVIFNCKSCRGYWLLEKHHWWLKLFPPSRPLNFVAVDIFSQLIITEQHFQLTVNTTSRYCRQSVQYSRQRRQLFVLQMQFWRIRKCSIMFTYNQGAQKSTTCIKKFYSAMCLAESQSDYHRSVLLARKSCERPSKTTSRTTMRLSRCAPVPLRFIHAAHCLCTRYESVSLYKNNATLLDRSLAAFKLAVAKTFNKCSETASCLAKWRYKAKLRLLDHLRVQTLTVDGTSRKLRNSRLNYWVGD